MAIPSLTMYGEDVTPNQHKLALQFGVLDNFYDSGEVSGDGHDWSNAAITSDYNEKTWQITYRGNEHIYDYQGTVADEFPLEHGEPDIDDPGTGYLWDNLASHGLTYRDYGEYIAGVWCKAAKKSGASPQEGTPSRTVRSATAHGVSARATLAAECRAASRSPSPVALGGAVVEAHEADQGGSARPLRSALSRFQHCLSRSTSRRRIPQ